MGSSSLTEVSREGLSTPGREHLGDVGVQQDVSPRLVAAVERFLKEPRCRDLAIMCAYGSIPIIFLSAIFAALITLLWLTLRAI